MSGPLPADLIDALARMRSVEAAADRHDQRIRAIAASGSLMLAAANEGWRITAMAKHLGINRQTASKRVAAARVKYVGELPGLEVPSSPAKLRVSRARTLLDIPLAEREWLSMSEASEFVGASPSSVRNWLYAGMLPNTQRGTRRNLYLRADLVRVRRAPRYKARGADRAALLKRIRQSPA